MASGRCEHSISGGNDIVPDLPCKKCEESDTFIEAIAYCRQCNESYCKLCLRDHNRFIKGHTVLGQAEKDDWGKPIVSHFQGIGVECSEHEGQDISLYCGLHDNVCCPVCVVLHHSDKCKPKMLYIRKAAQGLATSADYLHFMTANDQLCARIVKTVNNISELMTALVESRKTCKSEAEELCKRLTEHIKNCTDNSIAHINYIHDNVEGRLAEEIVTCADMKQILDDIRSSMQIKGPLDESFAFVTMKTHKGELQRYESSLRMLGKTTSNSYTFQGSAVIQQLIRSNELGDCTENAADVASDVLNSTDTVSGSMHGENNMFAGVEVKLEAHISDMPRGGLPEYTFDKEEAGLTIHFFEKELVNIANDLGGATTREPSVGQPNRVTIKCTEVENVKAVQIRCARIKQDIQQYTREAVDVSDRASLAEKLPKWDADPKYMLYSSRDSVCVAGPICDDVKKGVHKLKVALGIIKPTSRSDRGSFNRSKSIPDSNSGTYPSGSSNTYPDLSNDTSSSFTRRCGGFAEPDPKDIYVEETLGEFLKFKVYKGSILKLNVDVIVNAANDTMIHGGGVARIISDAAGYDLDKESREYILRHRKVGVTRNCVTTAGKLKYKAVIHAVGPKWYMYRYMYVKAVADYSKRCESFPTEFHVVDIDTEILQLVKDSFRRWKKDETSIDQRKTVPEYLKKNPEPYYGGGSYCGGGHGSRGCGGGYRGNRDFSNNTDSTDQNRDNGWREPKPDYDGAGGRGHPKSYSDVVQSGRSGAGGGGKSWEDKDYSRKPSSPSCKVENDASQKIGQSNIIADCFKLDGHIKVLIYTGSIDKVRDLDAMACAADEYLYPSGMKAKSLKKAGGYSYLNALSKMRTDDYCKKQPGDVAVSGAGDLRVKQVIHVVMPRASAPSDISMFKKAMSNVLEVAEKKHITSLALPLIGTGGIQDKQWLLDKFCNAFVETVCDFGNQTSLPGLKNIHLINKAQPVCHALIAAFSKVVGKRPKDPMAGRPLPTPPPARRTGSPMDIDEEEEEDDTFDHIPADKPSFSSSIGKAGASTRNTGTSGRSFGGSSIDEEEEEDDTFDHIPADKPSFSSSIGKAGASTRNTGTSGRSFGGSSIVEEEEEDDTFDHIPADKPSFSSSIGKAGASTRNTGTSGRSFGGSSIDEEEEEDDTFDHIPADKTSFSSSIGKAGASTRNTGTSGRSFGGSSIDEEEEEDDTFDHIPADKPSFSSSIGKAGASTRNTGTSGRSFGGSSYSYFLP